MRILLAFIALCTGYIVGPGTVMGQPRESVSISVGLAIESSIEIETISNINLGRIQPGQGEVFIDPKSDPGAGLLKLSGRPDALIRISFAERRELIRVGGGGVIQFLYLLAGSTRDEQSTSDLIQLENRDLRMGRSGEYFIWVGGTVSLDGVVFGQYEGEFTIEIDYL
jgi:hypothetical protein